MLQNTPLETEIFITFPILLTLKNFWSLIGKNMEEIHFSKDPTGTRSWVCFL
jgi:hypothetical protein